MKICFYCDSIFSFGGVQRVLAAVAVGLSVKHEVTIVTCDKPEKADLSLYGLKETTIRFRYLHYPSLPWYEFLPCKFYSFLYKKILPQNRLTTRGYAISSFSGTYRKHLLRCLQEENYDVIVGVHVYPAFQLASLRKYLRAYLVGWLHTSVEAFFYQPGLWLWKGEKRFQYQLEILDKIIVLTHADQQWYWEHMGLKTEVIRNPLAIVAHGKGDKQNKKFLAIGRLSPRTKGFDILIKAFALFARQNKEWTLEIVGEGPEEPVLRELILHYGLEKRIRLCPFTQQIAEHYCSASIFVLSSRWEGFPMVLGEAMAYCLPLIASDLPVVCEWLKDKENTLIFKNEDIHSLADCMIKMVKRTDWAAMEKVSSRLAEELTLPKILKTWEHLLAEKC